MSTSFLFWLSHLLTFFLSCHLSLFASLSVSIAVLNRSISFSQPLSLSLSPSSYSRCLDLSCSNPFLSPSLSSFSSPCPISLLPPPRETMLTCSGDKCLNRPCSGVCWAVTEGSCMHITRVRHAHQDMTSALSEERTITYDDRTLGACAHTHVHTHYSCLVSNQCEQGFFLMECCTLNINRGHASSRFSRRS